MSTPFYTILSDQAQKHIALVKTSAGYAVPEFEREDGARFNTVGTVNESVLKKWGIVVTVARCIRDGAPECKAVFVLHLQEQNAKLPQDAEWVQIDRLKNLDYSTAEQREIVSTWIESEQDEVWKTVPWSSPSWLPKATKWIRETVEASGAKMIGEPKQIRVWAISCVYRIETTAGTVYFKALPGFLGHEPKLARYMFQQFPQHTPDVTAVEANEHWMLLKEMGGPEPESKEDWELVLRTLNRIQNQCTKNLDELLQFGVKDCRLAKLPDLMAPIIAELEQPEMRAFYEVTEEEAKVLTGRLRTLPELCAQLAACGIPDTLMHGDLWGPNVVLRDKFSGKSPIIFDWTDSSISHPMLDIFCLLWAEKDDAKRRGELEAHTNVWSEIYPREKVMRAFELAERLAPYYYLLSWRNVELRAPVHSRFELMYLVLRFVRRILNESLVQR
jgi:hypothetical protein